jgi:hypothetical protein
MKKFSRTALPMMLIMIFAAVVFIGVAYAGSYWQVKNDRFSGTAGETLTVGQVACIKASDNKIYKADADDATLRPAIGVIGKGGAVNTIVEIVTDGILAGASNATPGERLYLSATAGSITTTAPNNPQVIGFGLPGTTANVTTTYKIHVELSANAAPGY